MTVYAVVSAKDRAMDAFMQPWFVPRIQMAVRSFADEVNRSDSPMFKHPDDYDLYCIGQWDDASGVFMPVSPPDLVCRGKDVVVKPE